MNLEITRGVPTGQEVRAAEILYDTFSDKFEKIFGPKAQIVPLLSEHFSNDRTVTASRDGVLVGVGGLKFGGKGFIDITFWQLVQNLRVRILTFLLVGWVLGSPVGQNEILVGALAVAQDMRGQGIGGRLMECILDFARSEEYERVKLYVIGPNERAKRFYERIGFKEKRIDEIVFPWSRILGFNEVFEMIYML